MSTLLKTTLAATGILVATLTTPAMAEMLLSEQQGITGILTGQGYSDVRFSELDRDMIVLARRDGLVHSFTLNGSGSLVPVGMGTNEPAREFLLDRSHESNGDYIDGFGTPTVHGQVGGGSDH